MAVAAVGMMMMAAGNIKKNADQATAEQKNANEFRRQGKVQELINARKMELLQRQQQEFIGKKTSQFAKAGISLSGSALDMLAADQTEMAFERNYAMIDNQEKANAYYNEANKHQSAADSLNDPLNMFLGVGGSVLTGYSGSSSMRGS